MDLNRKEIVTEDYFDYDISNWLMQTTKNLGNFKYSKRVKTVFHTSDEQFELVESYFNRYGRDAQSFGKIMTRLWIGDMLRTPKNNKG